MKKTVLTLMVSMFALQAKADTLTVEFLWCSANPANVCALVYGANGAPEEMLVDNAGPTINQQILSSIGPQGRSLARNIEGRVFRVTGFAGQYSKLQVTSLNSYNQGSSRPRGF